MYMPELTNHGLQAVGGGNILLESISVAVVFRDLLAETIITQTYRNREAVPVEAVYSFPLASQAVLLGLEVCIGDRCLQGVAVAKPAAEERYEQAIADGNAAIMLEQAQPGLYTMNVGNILAGERVVVSITTAELHTWQDNSLRFILPTSIAPRYGDPEKAGLQPHQIAETDPLAEHRFQLKLTLTGVLTQAELECPSHQVAISPSATATTVQLAAGEACMDRDFILILRLPQTPTATLHIDRDLDDGWVALASFVPQLSPPQNLPPKSIKIVVDCSGSMAGDSISQARQAISDILSLLRAEDFFNVILFGNTHRQLFDRQVPATGEHLTTVRRLLRGIEADMGGTEMQVALLATVDIPGPPISQDILLITDGEIWQSEELIMTIRRKAHRVFSVGVGSAVAEGMLRRLSNETGGACELVAPREGMAEKIVRHFHRILLPRAEKVTVRWPIAPLRVIPAVFGPVFHGDTLHVFARFATLPAGPVSLELSLEDGRMLTQTITSENPEPPDDSMAASPSTLARMAIARDLNDQEDKAIATALAVRYQLVSPYTNFLVVDERQEEHQAKTMPVLRKVPQMLAAGWGGTGMVASEPDVYRSVSARVLMPSSADVRFSKAASPTDVRFSIASSIDWRQRTTPESFFKKCGWRHTNWLLPVLRITSFSDLIACELPDRILDALKDIVAAHLPEASEAMVVLAFLQTLTTSPAQLETSRTFRRALHRSMKKTPPDERLLAAMRLAFAHISADDWGPEYPLKEEDDDAA